MPENVNRALNMAIIATNTEKEEKALGTTDRGNNVRVFTVRGGRGNAPGNRYGKPRENSNGAGLEVLCHSGILGRYNIRGE